MDIFVGREEEQHQLDQFIDEQRSGVLIVTGCAGIGKSALLENWEQRRYNSETFIISHSFSRTCPITESYRNIIDQLFSYHNILADGSLPNQENLLRDAIFRLIGQYGSREGQPLVIILDGLDEAEKLFDPLFIDLPEGVFVIASARTGTLDDLSRWTENAHLLQLDRLPQQAIQLWLEEKGLSEYAQDKSFIEELDETSNGFPLYLHFLLEEISTLPKSDDLFLALRQSPKGFAQCVKEQFVLLAESIENYKKIEDLFNLLLVTPRALSMDDIAASTGMRSRDFARLPWQIKRWFNIENNLYSFTHPLLAQEFQKFLSEEELSRTKIKLEGWKQ